MTNTRELHVDGTESDGFTLSGDGTNAPFFVFDADKQDWIAGPYQTKEEAETALKAIS
jgi:hypothetical protein